MSRFKQLLQLFLIMAFVLATTACDNSGNETPDGDVDVDTETESEVEAPLVIQPFDYCEPNTPPDKVCYAQKRNPDSAAIKLAKSIADKQIAKHQPNDIIWDWGEATMMIGMKELYRVTGEKKYFDYYKAWIDYHIEEGFMVKKYIATSDTCAPVALAISLYEETKEQKYADLINEAFNYFENVALKTEEGGLNHMGDWDLIGVTLWIDSLFMFGNVMTGWGEFTDDKTILDEYAEQHEIFTDLLLEKSGLYKHAYGYLGEQSDNVYWGRGNSWVTVATADHLRVRLARGERVEAMKQAMDTQIAAIIPLQDENTGLWWTILNRPGETYLETSCAALFAYGMTRAWRYGLTDDSVLPVIKKAMKGVNSMIIKDENDIPTVTGTSGPTSVGEFESYKIINQTDDISFGIGAAMLALIETSGLPE